MPPANPSKDRRSSRIRERTASRSPRESAPSRRRTVTQNTLANQQIHQNQEASGIHVASVPSQNSEPSQSHLEQQVTSLTQTVLSLQQQLSTVTSMLTLQTGIVGNPISNTPTSSMAEPICNMVQTGTQPVNENILNIETCTDTTNTTTLQQALPLGALVTDSIKNKIWANEYIELATLLPNENIKPSALPIVVEGEGHQRRLRLQQTPKQTKTIDQWVSAFSIYMAIYCEKYKDLFPQLVKYMDIIRNMSKQKGNWKMYDIEFRQSKCQLSVSWGNMHHSLWLQYMLADQNDVDQYSINNNIQPHAVNNIVPRIPYGYCIRFHQGNYCRTPYHKCYVCNMYHSAAKCWYNQGFMQQGYQPALRGPSVPLVGNTVRKNFRFVANQQQFARAQPPNPSPRWPRPPSRYQSPFRSSKR